MKRLLAVIIVATLAYSGWWFYAAHDLRSSIENWFSDQRASGLQVNYADLSIVGFPNRTDLTITEPVISASDKGFGWQAPFLQILGLSYKKGHVIVAWPDTQYLTTDQGNIAVTSDGLRASVVHDNGTIMRSNLVAIVLNMTGPDRTIALAEVNAALQQIEIAPLSYRLALSVGSIATTSPQITTNIGPESLGSLRAELEVTLDRPLTFSVMEGVAPQPTEITIKRSEITYGSVTFKVSGTASLDPQGLATGEITIAAENWQDAVAAARDNGDLPPGLSDSLIDILSMLSTLSGTREALDVTLGLDRSTILIGPIPVGKLPPLRWR
ncbi:DUF2125 domain-containing protein [Marivita sp.]|uniref:DUF2125 domain-containing protein n=1 Tax=Marivita sp. TaxID=2003365 RepID=UPI003F6CE273